ncbi:alkyl/aryl-sulfatase [Sorangium sp. So ce426]|uniref:alkyl/aryl-sulfatase n=1 Tax=Sorangium sp. So ce426 TaxID=3133312 RepID=UPI003F5B4BF3
MTTPIDPAPAVEAAHAAYRAQLPFSDRRDFKAADRGFLGTVAEARFRGPDGAVVWDGESYAFLQGEAPTSVHPSLWRQSLLVAKHGLYEVVEGIYQVRGFDLSNVTFVEGDTGVIVIDPLISSEPAAAALALYREHRGDRPVVAVIYTHSHIDHFGGVFGVTSQAEVDGGKVQILAPESFVHHAVAENVFAGVAMGRRAGYMYGAALARGPRGQVGAGLGQTTSTGSVGFIVPTLEVRSTGETHSIDGVEIEFQMAPGSEAPAEMHLFFPGLRALCIAENATHTLHNVLTLRGALVRDPHAWAGYLTEAIERFGDRADVVFASHHWPTWGRDEVLEYLSLQRDLYAYLHDQTLRMINRGLTGAEIAEQIVLPPALQNAWHARGYYGSVSHNVKAIYQRYMGWFDGNPAQLWPHPPEALAARYVDAIGGVDRVLDIAKCAYDAGDFRWAATLLSHAVFVASDDARARALYADTLDQLGYGSENGTWRNFFLSGATELRKGNFGTPTATNAPTIVARLTPDQLFDSIAVKINGPRAWDLDLRLDIALIDLKVNYRVTLRNGVLVDVERPADGKAQLTLRLSKARLIALLSGDSTSEGIDARGDMGVLERLMSVIEEGDPSFDIVLP